MILTDFVRKNNFVEKMFDNNFFENCFFCLKSFEKYAKKKSDFFFFKLEKKIRKT